MKQTKVEGGVLWQNDGLIPEGIYDGTNLVVLQPGESHLVATRPEASKTDNAGPVACAMVYTDGD